MYSATINKKSNKHNLLYFKIYIRKLEQKWSDAYNYTLIEVFFFFRFGTLLILDLILIVIQICNLLGRSCIFHTFIVTHSYKSRKSERNSLFRVDLKLCKKIKLLLNCEINNCLQFQLLLCVPVTGISLHILFPKLGLDQTNGRVRENRHTCNMVLDWVLNGF